MEQNPQRHMRLFHLHLATIGLIGISRSIYAVPVPTPIILDIHSLQKEHVRQNDHNIIIEVIPYRALAAPMLCSVPKKLGTITQIHRIWRVYHCSTCCKPTKRPPETRARSDFVTKLPLYIGSFFYLTK